MLFLGDGLIAEPNAASVTPHFLGAIAIGCAVFLLLKLSHPYSGMIRLSSAPLDRLMLQLGDPAKPAD
jgi:hypothetical protein